MYKLLHYVFFILIIAIPNLLPAQKGLQPGNVMRMGDVTTSAHAAYKPIQKALGNKPIVISFCNTLCKNCRKQFNTLTALQNQFKNKVVVVAVVPQSKQALQDYLQINNISQLNIPVITDDSLLNKLFPHRYVSHNVFINKKAVVQAITESEYLTAANIVKLINENLQIPLKNDFAVYDYKKRILAVTDSFYTGFSGYQQDARTGYAFDTTAAAVRFYAYNYSIPALYLIAFGKNIFFPANRIVLEVSNKDKYQHNKSHYSSRTWYQNFSYSYEQVLPASLSQQQRKQQLVADLNKHFNISGSIQNRSMFCYVLRCTDSALLATKGGAFKNTLSSASVKQLTNAPINQLVYALDKNSAIPVLDETGFKGKADVLLPAHTVNSLLDYNQALQQHGLILQPAERELEVLVITEKNNPYE